MVKVAESKRPATSFLQPLLEKEEQACAHCGLSVACGADVSTCAGSGRAFLKATTLRTKQSDLLSSIHRTYHSRRAAFLPECFSWWQKRRTLAESCKSKLWDLLTLHAAIPSKSPRQMMCNPSMLMAHAEVSQKIVSPSCGICRHCIPSKLLRQTTCNLSMPTV